MADVVPDEKVGEASVHTDVLLLVNVFCKDAEFVDEMEKLATP